MTFCATVQAVRAVGAAPRFIDVDPATLCVTPQLVMDAVTDDTAAVLPVLFGGRAVDLSSIREDLAERGIVVIEDAAHAFGSHCGSEHVGADVTALTCLSFGPVKNLTCGQGGAVIPRTPEEAAAVRRLRMLGVTQSQSERERAETTSYRVEGFGLRYQLSSINAAIGLAQFDHFDATVCSRLHLWRTYRDALDALEGVTLVDVDLGHTVPHLCQVRVPHRDHVFAHLRARNMASAFTTRPTTFSPPSHAGRVTCPPPSGSAGKS